MQKKIYFLLMLFALITLVSFSQKEGAVWGQAKANSWYKQQGWLRGCDFITSSAVNQLELWQAETFDSAGINRELGYAESIGLNCMRVFLHHAAWQQDKDGFKKRMDIYLSIANSHHIKTMFVFFDDCWNESYKTGTQPAPKVGVHNSGWLRDPGKLLYDDPSVIATLEMYVKDILNTFKNDERILIWDLYNEPGNSGYGNKTMPLLENIFNWARQVNPSQPLSAGVWNPQLKELNAFQLANSDVITYHNYEPQPEHQNCIDTLTKYNRPMICTEYMARIRNSRFDNIMPMLKAQNVGAINWGLVSGKTNTIYAWDTPMPDGSEPKTWFHDIFRKDGTPYSEKEIELIKKLTGKN
ncbi:MAG TPA: cellulase family glycosylhydrolase [Chitinophagaceae bacterium]|nr:cellulase family glycosylhydrolase [Chitinophagaceae bacterium]